MAAAEDLEVFGLEDEETCSRSESSSKDMDFSMLTSGVISGENIFIIINFNRLVVF